MSEGSKSREPFKPAFPFSITPFGLIVALFIGIVSALAVWLTGMLVQRFASLLSSLVR